MQLKTLVRNHLEKYLYFDVVEAHAQPSLGSVLWATKSSDKDVYLVVVVPETAAIDGNDLNAAVQHVVESAKTPSPVVVLAS
ncbi:hypothetical protein HDU91_003643, partial [Kappamyces sp. JEL0680]